MKKLNSKMDTLDLQGRRRLLKTAVIGSAATVAMPDKWTRPVVDSVLLPAHAATTMTDSSPIFPNGFRYSAHHEDDNLIPDPALLATNDSSLMELLVPTAHAQSFDFSSTTDFYLAHISGTEYEFTSSRTFIDPRFNGINNNYWAGGKLKIGETVGLSTHKNCGDERLYVKHVELVSVDEDKAVINVRLVFKPLEIDEVIYTRTLLVDPGASPSACTPA